MTGTDEAHHDVERMRDEARRLTADAEHTTDPAERDRLRQRIRRLEFDSEQESMMAAGDIYPAR